MSHRHNLCHIAMPRLCSDRYSYSKKRNVYQLDGVLLNFCTRRTGQSVVTPVPTGTRAACSTGDLNTNFDTEQVVPTPDDTAQQSMGMWYYCRERSVRVTRCDARLGWTSVKVVVDTVDTVFGVTGCQWVTGSGYRRIIRLSRLIVR